MSRTKEILSQAAAAPLLITAAICADEQQTWSRQERAHRRARTRTAGIEQPPDWVPGHPPRTVPACSSR